MANLTKELAPRKWRTQQTQDRYQTERQEEVKNDTCPLCTDNSIAEFIHWRIIPNKYPYDAIASKHTMIIPKEHLRESELSQAALDELDVLKRTTLNEEYLYIIEALPKTKSIPGHFHLHLLIPKVVG
jgi:galactose-1-phosphate uridylyltransferase